MTTSRPIPWRDLGTGARAMVPWLAGVAPFGLVIGVTAAKAHIPTLAGWFTGPLIFAGSAQVATIGMLDKGAASIAVIATALMINLRLVLYSGAMATHWRGTPLWWRLLAGYLLIDPSFAVGVDRYERPGDRLRAHAHYLGGALALWVAWLAAIALGATAGAGLPASLHLDLLVPLFLLGEVVSRLRQPATRRAALTAAAVAVPALLVPLHLGVALATVAGIAVATATRPTAHRPSTPDRGDTARPPASTGRPLVPHPQYAKETSR
jgi:predicted branched-subunit amino acid permease